MKIWNMSEILIREGGKKSTLKGINSAGPEVASCQGMRTKEHDLALLDGAALVIRMGQGECERKLEDVLVNVPWGAWCPGRLTAVPAAEQEPELLALSTHSPLSCSTPTRCVHVI